MADPKQSQTSVDPSQALFRSLNRIVKPLVKAGLGSPLPIGLGAVVLESTGRVSGKPREVPLLGLRIGDRVLVSTVRDDSQWVKNLEADGNAAVWFCGKKRSATASVNRGPLNMVTLDSNDDTSPDSTDASSNE
ncbi:MAG: nitroreductase/quinone reductase family protein [Acidimicrobiales bacterium]